MDKYLSIQVGRLLFLDSMQFTLQGLESLVSTLNPEDFVHTTDFFGFGQDRTTYDHCHNFGDDPEKCSWCIQNIKEEKFRYATQKGIFFYDYFDSISRLDEKRLPDQDKFYNTLNDTGCTNRDYARADRVFKIQKMQSLRDYHDFYLKTDVLLLADFFEKFRDMFGILLTGSMSLLQCTGTELGCLSQNFRRLVAIAGQRTDVYVF